jgi:protein-S-isoprenylcysteine O-methyltransferase Ste14
VAYTALAAQLLWPPSEWGVLMLPSVLHELFVAGTFLIRPRPRRTLPGLLPKAVGYAHTFLLLAFLQFASAWHPDWIRPTPNETLRFLGGYLWLISTLVGIWPVWQMRRSFSLEPEARSLVTSGPFRFARHPIYAVYIVNFIGIWLHSVTPAFTAVMALWFVLLLIRVRYEERVLAEAFPEYADYRRRVGAFGPRFVVIRRLDG